MHKRKFGRWILGAIVFGAVIITAMGLATMYLWNWLVPVLFGGSVITFCQAIGLIALGKLLTGFMGWGRHCGGRHYGMSHGGRWKEKWGEKMANMTPEEKEKFKNYYYERCGGKGWLWDKETKKEASPEQ